MSYTPLNPKEEFKRLHQDGVFWKAQRLWKAADDADSQALAINDIVEMICCIDNEAKRSYYIDNVQKECKIKNSLVKKGVKELLQKREAKKQAEIIKKKIEAQFSDAQDAGLPNGFKGNLHDALKYGIYEHEGVYYTRGGKSGGDYVVSNFTMKILYHVNTGNELAYRLIAVRNVWGIETFINLNTDDFVSLGSFKKVLARRGDFIFKGTDSDLSRLQEYLQKDEVSTIYIQTLGWFKRGKFYAFANGIMPLATDDEKAEFLPVDEYGIISHGEKNYFLPAQSKVYADKDDMFVSERKFIFTKPVDSFGFTEWADLFYKTYGQKAIAGILFYIGALFRDIVMKQVQRYPILNLFGPPGAGKGQFAESLMSLFGEKQDQIMLGGASTVVGFMRKFAQLCNALVWLDEYKNNLPFKFIESFKNIYDGKGYERGKMSNDFATESTPIHSGCILSGQDMPTIEPALFMRVILLTFEDGKFSDDQRKNFSRLKELEYSGLSYITANLVQYREYFEQHFKLEYDRIFRQTYKEDVTNSEVDDRMIVNISMLLSFYQLFKNKVKFPFTYQEAKAFLIDNMLVQHGILAGNNDVAKFWDVVQTIFAQGMIAEDKDFELKDGYIYLRLMQVYPHYMKEMRQRGDANVLAKPTLDYYLRLDKSVFVEYKKKRFDDQSNNWCLMFKYARLQELFQLDLIRVKKDHWDSGLDQINKLEAKQKEMGVFNQDTIDMNEELPFGKASNG
ncbi:MAG TPA: hypothetical protein VEB42_03665 [Chitinophagaceae bacterium]|nr:hypothetical protein [Chitinophagaceae bacterium]